MTENGPFSWRPIEPGDVAAWVVLLTAVVEADNDTEHYGEQDLLELFELPDTDFASGSIAAFDGPVMIAGAFLMTRPTADPVHDLRFDGSVHPDYRRRGLGDQVIDWVEQAAVPVHEKVHPGRPLTLRGSSISGNAGHDALFAARGYRPVRWWHSMRMDLSAAPSVSASSSAPASAAAAAPDGVRITGFAASPTAADDALLVRNEAFQDHWGSTEITAETWAHYMSQESFRPAFSYLAYDDDGQPIGVLLGYEYDAETKATGIRDLYIAVVGTRRAARGRGIASALLSRVLADAKAAGFGSSSLFVDSDSLTGAVGLYERVGFTVEQSSITQSKDLIPAAD